MFQETFWSDVAVIALYFIWTGQSIRVLYLLFNGGLWQDVPPMRFSLRRWIASWFRRTRRG